MSRQSINTQNGTIHVLSAGMPLRAGEYLQAHVENDVDLPTALRALAECVDLQPNGTDPPLPLREENTRWKIEVTDMRRNTR